MKVVRGRADARWLPDRYHFALSRLLAYLRMRAAKPEPRDVALIVDRHQNRAEAFGLSVWMPLTIACYVAAMLSARWPRPAAFLAAIPIAVALLQAVIVVVSVVVIPLWNLVTRRRVRNVMRVSSAFLMLSFLAAAVWFSRSPTWARFVAWHVLGIAGLNAVAAGIMFLLRGAIADLERAVGGFSSEL